jgi:large subunit ribosomal protein L27
MSSKKAAGKLKQQKRTLPKFLGVKVSDGERVNGGEILVRQRGETYKAGKNVKVGRDYTLFSTSVGTVKFGKRLGRTTVSVQ